MLNNLSFYCLLGFVASSFYSPTARALCLIVGLSLWALSQLSVRSSKLKANSPDSCEQRTINQFLIVYVIAHLVVQFIHSQEISHWLKSLVSTYAQCFWIYAMVNRDDRYQILQKTLVLVGASLALIVVLQLFGLLPMAGNYYGVLSQPFTSSGMLLVSFFVSLSLRSVLAKATTRFAVWSMLTNFSIVVQAIAIFALGQRSTWLGLMLALIVYTFIQKLYLRPRFWITLLVIGLAGTLISTSSERVQRKLERFVQPQTWSESKTMQDRGRIWQLNYQAWQAKVGFGIGKIVEYKGLAHAHNIYLQQLFTGGVFKFAAWLLLYWSIGFALLKLVPESPEYFCSYLALSIEGLMENWWGDGEVVTLFVVLVVLALVKVKKKI